MWLGLLLAPGNARADAPLRAELTALYDSGNLLGSGDASPPPWEGLQNPRSGRDSRLRLVLTDARRGFLPHLSSFAALRLELDLPAGAASGSLFRDRSSFLGVRAQAASGGAASLRVFPFDADYLRLGYLHALDWGGSDGSRNESIFLRSSGSAPAVELRWDGPRLVVFAAAKRTSSDAVATPEPQLWGALFGGSFGAGGGLWLDAGFGYFQRRRSVAPISGRPGFVEGVSVRLLWARGRREPELAAEPFRAPSLRQEPWTFEAPATTGLAVALEGVALVIRQPTLDFGRGALTLAPAAAAYASLRHAGIAAHAAVSWRSLPFVLRNDARLALVDALIDRSGTHPELAAWLGASLELLPWHLVPGVELGLRLPAALERPSVVPGFAQTFVVETSGLEALPLGAGALPVVAARLAVRFQASSTVAFALFGEYQRDANRVTFDASNTGVLRSFAAPDTLSLLLASQARF